MSEAKTKLTSPLKSKINKCKNTNVRQYKIKYKIVCFTGLCIQ